MEDGIWGLIKYNIQAMGKMASNRVPLMKRACFWAGLREFLSLLVMVYGTK